MNLRLALVLWTAILCSLFISVVGGEQQSAVVELHEGNYNHLTSNGYSGHWMVEFYSPNCGHCKTLEPIYEKLAQELKDAGSTTRLGRVNFFDDKRLSKFYGVERFPTLFYMANGEMERYKGERTYEALKSYLEVSEMPKHNCRSMDGQQLTHILFRTREAGRLRKSW